MSSRAKPLPQLPGLGPHDSHHDPTPHGIPKSPLLPPFNPPLSLSGRDHVRKIITQCILDESLPKSWVELVHIVVEDISKDVREFDWFRGLKAARDFRRQRTLLWDSLVMSASGTNTTTSPNPNVASGPASADANNAYDATVMSNRAAPGEKPNSEKDLLKSTLTSAAIGNRVSSGSYPRPSTPASAAPTAPNGSGTSSTPRRLRPPKLRGSELQELNARALGELQRLANISNVMDLSCNPPYAQSPSPPHHLQPLAFPDNEKGDSDSSSSDSDSEPMLHLLVTVVFSSSPSHDATPSSDPFIASPASHPIAIRRHRATASLGIPGFSLSPPRPETPIKPSGRFVRGEYALPPADGKQQQQASQEVQKPAPHRGGLLLLSSPPSTPPTPSTPVAKPDVVMDLSGVDLWKSLYRVCEQTDDLKALRTMAVVGGKVVIDSSFAATLSTSQRDSLVKVLRLALYAQLSNILELSLLQSSHVEIIYPLPPPPSPLPPPSPSPVQPSHSRSLSERFHLSIPGSFPHSPPRTPPQNNNVPLSPVLGNSPSGKSGRGSGRSRFGGVWSFLTRRGFDIRSHFGAGSPTPGAAGGFASPTVGESDIDRDESEDAETGETDDHDVHTISDESNDFDDVPDLGPYGHSPGKAGRRRRLLGLGRPEAPRSRPGPTPTSKKQGQSPKSSPRKRPVHLPSISGLGLGLSLGPGGKVTSAGGASSHGAGAGKLTRGPLTRKQTEDTITRLAIGSPTSSPNNTLTRGHKGGASSDTGAESGTEIGLGGRVVSVGGAPTVDPFGTALAGITSSAAVFSTSPGVRFEPPETLVRLARGESSWSDDLNVDPPSNSVTTKASSSDSTKKLTVQLRSEPSTSTNRSTVTSATGASARRRKRITGADKAALSSILGWKPDGSGTGFGTSVSTFLKHQCLTVLYSNSLSDVPGIGGSGSAGGGTPRPMSPAPTAASVSMNDAGIPGTGASTPIANSNAVSVAAGPGGGSTGSIPPRLAQWRTYRYYDEREATLGQWLVEAAEEVEIIAHQTQIQSQNQGSHSQQQQQYRPSSLALAAASTMGVGVPSAGAGTGTNTGAKSVTLVEHCWMHLQWKLTAKLAWRIEDAAHAQDDAVGADEDEMESFVSCAVCGKETAKSVLSNGAWLLDFGKFLELLFYSEDIYRLSAWLCEHTPTSKSAPSSPANEPASPPASIEASSSPPITPSSTQPRSNIVRHFIRGPVHISFHLSHVADSIFDVRIPRCQVTRSIAEVTRRESKWEGNDEWLKTERDRLRLDMTFCWKGLKDRLRWLEDIASDDAASTTSLKPLPTPPAFTDSPEENVTPTRRSSSAPQVEKLTSIPSTTNSSHGSSKTVTTSNGSTGDSASAPALSSESSQRDRSSTIKSDSSSGASLSSLRDLITSAEAALYRQLAHSSLEDLGDIRRAFIMSASDTYQRLRTSMPLGLDRSLGGGGIALATSSLSNSVSMVPPDLLGTLPDWWGPKMHCLPKSSVVVREAEWGSIIAFALRSPDYRQELRDIASGPTIAAPTAPGRNLPGLKSSKPKHPPVSMRRSVSGPIAQIGSPSTSTTSRRMSNAEPRNANDGEELLNQEVEDFSSSISRKDNPRDVTSLLSLREVLKHRKSFDTSSTPSKAGSSKSSSRYMPPKGAWAKPNVQVSMQNAGGEVTASMGSTFPDLPPPPIPMAPSQTVTGANSSAASALSLDRPAFTRSSTATASLSTVRGPSTADSSVFGTPTLKSYTTAATSEQSTSEKGEHSLHPSEVTNVSSHDGDSDAAVSAASAIQAPPPDAPSAPLPEHTSGKGLSSTFTTALKLMVTPSSPTKKGQALDTNTSPTSLSTSPYDETIHRLALLGLDQGPSFPKIDARPHVQYDFTIGNRLKFSCTSYYALQFSHLRKQCGVEETLMRSLERTTGWIAEGGKSKASFFKTADDRFILKTLVTAWHVSDLQVLLELSPSYFAYMNQTQDKPSALAKLLGFFSIEVKNLESGNIESKADILVMENLFWNCKPNTVYDLKGIRGRKSKSDQKKTLMDVDFMENQRKTPTYIGPRSKYVLQEALNSDAEFLASSNVMDYSLLLGVEHQTHRIICGLVDTFGTYTFAKTLESKAKHGLNSGKEKEVTVVPPSDYQARFLRAMDRYFISVPGKLVSLASIPQQTYRRHPPR
ncbi:hypothetical protein DL93DRAFT_2086239 [Clavulina sp. PMI_390]|nr:hypothetical protein DL93DRAFT_2086239 [Clavulina sp. PMI_390]